MKSKLLAFLVALLAATAWGKAQNAANLIPLPYSMQTTEGSLTLPKSFVVACNGLDSAMKKEVAYFADCMLETTQTNVSLADGNEGLFRVNLLGSDNALGDAGYELHINDEGVAISVKKPLGLYYAFQTVKKLLPPNVMANVFDPQVTSFSLPYVDIVDEPRFDYRGFMLDVSRHFFSVKEIKRILDVMSYYKMNKFHWHLTDDQGWRAEIKKYPKLTTIGATAPNCRFTSLEEARAYWTNRPYGPYYYTQDQMREIVAYAAERHIDVIPEVDMPGHFCAAMTAYPELSCTPDGAHTVWSDGGISYDILNVANPKSMQFIYDVIDELLDIFPDEYFHIGGDECPTNAWEGNEDCKKLYAQLGLTNWRQMQSYFIDKVDSFVKSRGRKLAMWNESITANGADTKLVQKTDASIYCWSPSDPAVAKASELGLPAIYTPWGPYYINRRQGNGPQDPPGAGDGTDNVRATYNRNIPSGTDYGVQGTFWCEWVSDSTYLEWLALPRMIAIAEIGWTPQNKRNFNDFISRVAADTTLLNYNNYRYCTYLFPGTENNDKVMPLASSDTAQYYYRIVSGGSDNERRNRCIELLTENSPLIATYTSNGAQANRLWTNAQADSTAQNYNYQWWTLEEDPNNAGHYALVCKAIPQGSVKATPTQNSVQGRWEYDAENKHYNFQLGTGAYGTKGSNHYYSIASDQLAGQYFNSSVSRQGLAVNVYSNPNDGNGGCWEFVPKDNYGSKETPDEPARYIHLLKDKLYMFQNTVEGFEGITIADNNTSSTLQSSTDPFAANAWRVIEATENADGTQSVTLQNASTSRFIGSAGNYVSRLGFPVSVGSSAAQITLSAVTAYDDIRLLNGGKSLFPLPSGLVYSGSTIDKASYDAARDQGAGWDAIEVFIATFVCQDEDGKDLGTFTRSIPMYTNNIDSTFCPVIKNHSVKTITPSEDSNTLFNVTYSRSAYSVFYNSTDNHGVLLDQREDTVAIGQPYTINLTNINYYTLNTSSATNGTAITLKSDTTINAIYTTDAITGVKREANAVTTLVEGNYYLMYDATTDNGRAGYRLVRPSDNQINRATSAEGLGPNAVWTLEGNTPNFMVKNTGSSLYVPQLVRSTATTASANGAQFTFALNNDGQTWNIRGNNGQYWDGVQNGALVGWDGGTGHPIRISTFWAQPMYTVTISCEDTKGNALQTITRTLNAGEAYTVECPAIEGYTFVSKSGDENYNGTLETYLNVTAVYKNDATGINSATDPGQSANENSGNGNLNSSDAPAYDLQGRPVSNPSRGIYIQDGKKRKY